MLITFDNGRDHKFPGRFVVEVSHGWAHVVGCDSGVRCCFQLHANIGGGHKVQYVVMATLTSAIPAITHPLPHHYSHPFDTFGWRACVLQSRAEDGCLI